LSNEHLTTTKGRPTRFVLLDSGCQIAELVKRTLTTTEGRPIRFVLLDSGCQIQVLGEC
jgi:hypothetical protein